MAQHFRREVVPRLEAEQRAIEMDIGGVQEFHAAMLAESGALCQPPHRPRRL
ncbi:hypothetical protein HMPREF9946_00431 [Acetobacteraceae bacterium AT-5844]|nr:hypothetical protein HMPREF9946_00431 [Acetobacteraceae bacterium AT-5844]